MQQASKFTLVSNRLRPSREARLICFSGANQGGRPLWYSQPLHLETDGSLSLHPPLPHSSPGSPLSHLNAGEWENALRLFPDQDFAECIVPDSNQRPQQSRNMGSAYKHQDCTSIWILPSLALSASCSSLAFVWSLEALSDISDNCSSCSRSSAVRRSPGVPHQQPLPHAQYDAGSSFRCFVTHCVVVLFRRN